MPTRSQHDSDAARQKAFRDRMKQARRNGPQANEMSPASSLSCVSHCNTLLAAALMDVETAQNEMQAYYDDRSEAWQDSAQGEVLQERIETLEAILDALTRVIDSPLVGEPTITNGSLSGVQREFLSNRQ